MKFEIKNCIKKISEKKNVECTKVKIHQTSRIQINGENMDEQNQF